MGYVYRVYFNDGSMVQHKASSYMEACEIACKSTGLDMVDIVRVNVSHKEAGSKPCH